MDEYESEADSYLYHPDNDGEVESTYDDIYGYDPPEPDYDDGAATPIALTNRTPRLGPGDKFAKGIFYAAVAFGGFTVLKVLYVLAKLAFT